MITHIKIGDALSELKSIGDDSIDCIITSPPYWALRDYGTEGQVGHEKNPDDYVSKLCDIFDEAGRVLKKTGTLWVNIGDTYGGRGLGKQGNTGQFHDRKVSKNRFRHTHVGISKSLSLIPARFAIEMTRRGWILRNEIIWHKPNVMPASCKDRFTVDFEPVFFFVKSKDYTFNQLREPLATSSIERVKYGWESKKANASSGISIKQMGTRFANPSGRNKRTVWKIPTSASKLAHVAMFPEKLVEPMIEAGSPIGGTVLDPFVGSGTTGVVAKRLGRSFIGIELNVKYAEMAMKRINETVVQNSILLSQSKLSKQ